MKPNHVVLEGHFTGNLCLHYFEPGFAVANFEIAVIRNLNECHCCDDEYDFFDVKAFGELAERVCKEFALDRRVRVEGCLRLEAQEADSSIAGCCVFVIADTVEFLPIEEGYYSDICISCREQVPEQETLVSTDKVEGCPFH